MHSSGILEISLSALQANYKLCDKKTGTAIVAPAVKANAYGTGMTKVAPALWDAGARHFFVATIEEGVALRALLPKAQIAILNGVLPGTEEDFVTHSLTPILNGQAQAELIATYSKRNALKINSILHIDTGMNRLGFRAEEMEGFFSNPENTDGLDIKTIMSHFSSADEVEKPAAEKQYDLFENTLMHVPQGIQKSLANSAGIFRDERFHYDMVRPGMCIYGLNPTPHKDNPMRPVVSLSVPVLQIHKAKKGESAGYSETHRFEKDAVLATVSLGYADGFLRHLSSKANLYWNGSPCPVLGRVSMDTVILDISHLSESARPRIGDMMEVIGLHQSADDLAAQAGTIGYEILTSLGARYQRRYID